MTTFVLVPGAGGAGLVYWARVGDALRAAGHRAVPVDFRGDDPALGLPEYAAAVDEAIGDESEVVLVAQSLGGFSVPMVSRRDAVARIVLVNAMIPLPGETPAQWSAATGDAAARRAADLAAGRSGEFDPLVHFLHDVPKRDWPDLAAQHRDPAPTPFTQPCEFDAWPDRPTRVLVGADDRFFPADFQLRIARERLGIDGDLRPGGHLIARSNPDAVVQYLLGELSVTRAQ